MKEFQQSVWRAVYITSEDHHQLYKHHLSIFEAIKSRDAVSAREAMMEHLTFAEQRSTAYVTRNQNGNKI
jgi:GntR family transcriptional repressor for pyruvate dehydrogenase complex